jgi:hypothetical protein
VWHIKEPSLLKAVRAKQRSKFAALSLVMVKVARLLKNCLCDSKQRNKQREISKRGPVLERRGPPPEIAKN